MTLETQPDEPDAPDDGRAARCRRRSVACSSVPLGDKRRRTGRDPHAGCRHRFRRNGMQARQRRHQLA